MKSSISAAAWLAFIVAVISLFHFISLPDCTTIEQSLNRTVAIRVYSPPKYSTDTTAAMCLVVKNETLYLDEWTDFHIGLGFTSIFIYDTSPSPDPSIIEWYKRREDLHPYVKVAHDARPGSQQVVYERCMREDSNDTFVAFFDVDEFLVLKKHDNVVDMLNEHCDENCGQLSINWLVMGTSNETKYRPVPVTKRNIHSEPTVSATVKVIVRPSYVNDESIKFVHTVDLKRGEWYDTNHTVHKWKYYGSWDKMYERIYNYDRPSDVALLHHYRSKSIQELHYKKCVRGHAMAGGSQTFCGDKNYDVGDNANKFDDSAWQQLKKMVPKYERFDMISVEPCLNSVFC